MGPQARARHTVCPPRGAHAHAPVGRKSLGPRRSQVGVAAHAAGQVCFQPCQQAVHSIAGRAWGLGGRRRVQSLWGQLLLLRCARRSVQAPSRRHPPCPGWLARTTSAAGAAGAQSSPPCSAARPPLGLPAPHQHLQHRAPAASTSEHEPPCLHPSAPSPAEPPPHPRRWPRGAGRCCSHN